MLENKSMSSAIDLYVESLKEEQKSNRLMENSIKNKKEEFDETEKEVQILEENGLEKLADTLKIILDHICNCEDVIIEVDQKKDRLSVYGSDLKNAIGRNGKNIEAIEHIINLIGKRKKLILKSISIDIKDYKKKRVEEIKRVALKMAKKAAFEGKKIMLRPMKPYERKIIHDVLSEDKTVITKSKNKEPYRRITIYPVK